MEAIHKEAVNCLINPDRDKTNLAQKLLEVNVNNLSYCMKGYWYLYHADLLGIHHYYLNAFENWQRHLEIINKNEKIDILKISDNCFWNLQLADLIKKIGRDCQEHYLNVLSFGDNAVKLMKEQGDYKSELTHYLFVGYASIMNENQKAQISGFIERVPLLIELHQDFNSSLTAEAKAVQGILSHTSSNEEIKSYLFSGFYKHLLYLHKKRCKNLIEHLES